MTTDITVVNSVKLENKVKCLPIAELINEIQKNIGKGVKVLSKNPCTKMPLNFLLSRLPAFF